LQDQVASFNAAVMIVASARLQHSGRAAGRLGPESGLDPDHRAGRGRCYREGSKRADGRQGGDDMIGSRYKRAGDTRRDTYAVIGPASEIGSVREWVLRNEKNAADEVIVTTTALEDRKLWERLD